MNDQAQRDQALDITQSYIVQAPAGSGKTELLTQRYLNLLSSCHQPENILAMTFTNKAVDEMFERVFSALKSTAKPKPKEAHKQLTHDLALAVMQRSNELGWDLLQNPKRLKIITIDGLASLVNARYPLESQFVPRNIMSEQWQRDRAYRHAARQVLKMIDDANYTKPISDLLLYLDNHVERFYRLITQMLAKRDQWLTRLYRDNVLDLSVLNDSMQRIITQHLEHLEAVAKPYLDENFFVLMQVATRQDFANVKELPGHTIDDLDKWKSIQSLCLNQSGDWRKRLDKNTGYPSELKAQKQALQAVLTQLSEQPLLTQALQQVSILPEAVLPQEQFDALETIAQVLKLCVAQLNLYFDQEQAHDFIEVALQADKALDSRLGVSETALFLDYKIQHLLIDEFQDTSVSQFNIIEKLLDTWQLGDGKTLFLVGDPMQSIYRFRESQVGLFLQVKAAGIAHLKPISLVLSANFRSSKSIVEANNTFFQSIFPEEDEIYQGAISYSSSIAASDATDENAVVFHPFAYDQYHQEAQRVVELVQTAQQQTPDEEVAILVRSRSHLKIIAQQLSQSQIAFESLKITKLKDHLLTRDLLSLTKALLHLGDKLAWLSVLRSPWCGLVLDDLLTLSEQDHPVIYHQLIDENIQQKLTNDGQKRAAYLYSCLYDAIENQGRFSFVELLTHAIDQLGITKSLSKTDTIIKQQFLQIIANCEQQQSLNSETIVSALEDLYAPSESSQVKLMTIHQSKGLEFDTVIIPGLGRGTKSDDSPVIRIKEFSNNLLLLAPIKSAMDLNETSTYAYLKHIDSQQTKFETMRLLYVAMTRAKRNLHLMGAVNQNNETISGSLLSLLMRFYRHRFEGIDQSEDANHHIDEPDFRRIAKLKTPHLKDQNATEMVDYQQNFDQMFKPLIGTLVHQYLENEHFLPKHSEIKNRLIELGVSPQSIEEWCDFVVHLLRNAKTDSNFDWLFKSRASTQVEAEFIIDGKLIIIDRLFVEDDILWVIDFKTAQKNPGETIEQFSQRQRNKYSQQLQHYQQCLSTIYTYKIQCALYCPAEMVLIPFE